MNRNGNTLKFVQDLSVYARTLSIIETSLVVSDVEHAEAQAETTSLSCVQFMHHVQEKHKEEEHVMK